MSLNEDTWTNYCYFSTDYDCSDFCDKGDDSPTPRNGLCQTIDGKDLQPIQGCEWKDSSCVPRLDCSTLDHDQCQSQLLCSYDGSSNKCQDKKDQAAICTALGSIAGFGDQPVNQESCESNTALCAQCKSYCLSEKDTNEHIKWLVQNHAKDCGDAEQMFHDECKGCY